MNREWSSINKKMQSELKKPSTYKDGIDTLISLRNILFNELLELRNALSRDDFNAIPFINADGYHSKTIAYSIWHIFRIEDIVTHSLILNDEEIIFRNDCLKKIDAPIITTGNELKGMEIAEFSKKLNIDELYDYAFLVKESTEIMLKNLDYDELKKSFNNDDKKRLHDLNVVSTDEDAEWLIDYWCNKNIRGLIEMPFSRHWIMHAEASLRIRDRIQSKKNKCR